MHRQQEIEQEIKNFIVAELMTDGDGASLTTETPIVEDGIVDSLGIFNLVSFVEKKFAIRVQPDDIVLENLGTITKLTSLVMVRLGT